MSVPASPLQQRFERDGYLIVRDLLPAQRCDALRAQTEAALAPLAAPVEFEADVGYPGAPNSRSAPGGNTPRRLLYAYGRHELYRELATGAEVARHLALLTGQDDWLMSQCHHNCVMTKAPGFSSETHWHQDIRYWSFDLPELVSVWVALGDEHERNGALAIIPGSHNMTIDRGRLDRDLFLRPELPANATLIRQAETVSLRQGDVLFFHCRAFHAAGCNRSTQTKLSCVFTYHRRDNQPIPGTRSATFESVPLAPAGSSA
ncbi:MAG: phytanoyl-CoA dioxygenase family protein [Pseudomonadota bacterium]